MSASLIFTIFHSEAHLDFKSKNIYLTHQSNNKFITLDNNSININLILNFSMLIKKMSKMY